MDRREHLKLLLAGSVGTGLFLSSCTEEELETSRQIIENDSDSYGRTADERSRDQQLHSETFFSDYEREMVEVLADIIIPADETSGSATDAGVPDFIEFMMKDLPSLQTPTRGGLMWLDNQCRQRYESSFVNCTSAEREELIDEIAYPDEAREEMQYGVQFFNRMRNLTATGFFTSQMGIEYLGYQGNRTNIWDGVPRNVLDKHGLSYDQKTLDECVQEGERDKIAEWDEAGNLIR